MTVTQIITRLYERTFSTETKYAVVDNSHIDVGRSIVQLHKNVK